MDSMIALKNIDKEDKSTETVRLEYSNILYMFVTEWEFIIIC